MRRTRTSTAILAAGAVIAATGALVACGGSSGGSGGGGTVTLNLVAYSTPQAAYAKIITAFQATAVGKNIKINTSFGASGDQSRAVVAGQPADIVNFSLEPDMKRLVDANLVASTWDQGQYKGDVTDSVAAILVRKGNPKHITTWTDLIKPGIEVLNPNPFSSGGARWNIMGAYGAQLKAGKTPAEAQAFLTSLFSHIKVQDDSARTALSTFTTGKGDALLDYENDAIFAQQNGQTIDYVVPQDTILIQNPVAVTSNSKHPVQAKAFLDYLYTPAAQKIFADNGYRPVVAGVTGTTNFSTPTGLFTIADVGGWSTVMTKFFDPTNGIVAKIEQGKGLATTPKPTPSPTSS